MLKNILLFIQSSINHNSLNFWAEQCEEQFKKHGIRTHFLSINNPAEKISADLSGMINSYKIDAALAFNASGQQNYITNGNKNLWDALGIPFYNYIVDHPLEHTDALTSGCQDYHVICVDQNHAEFTRKFFPGIRSVDFLPLGGFGELNAPFDDYEAFRSRNTEVALTAGLWDPDSILEIIWQYPNPFDKLALMWIDRMKNNLNEAPEAALRNALDERYPGGGLSDEDYYKIASFCRHCVPYIRTWIRKQIVEKLMDSGINIRLYGNGWEALNHVHKHSNVTLMGDIPIKDTSALYTDVKLAINIMPMFKSGTHDRISTAQIGGAAVLTDENIYLKELYPDDSIFFYNLNDIDKLGDKISSLITDEKKLYETAKRGHAIACKSLSWDNCSEKLIEIMETSR